MKILIWSLLAVVQLINVGYAEAQVQSKPKKYCYCEIGDEPKSQQGFFEIGCNMWVGQQGVCEVKKIVEQNHDYTQENIPAGSQLIVGYVGHWGGGASDYVQKEDGTWDFQTYYGGAGEMVHYLSKRIVPAMKKFNISAVVDNTACLAMDNPNKIQDYIHSLNLPRTQLLAVRGNQAISIGKWGDFAPSANFWATVSSTSNTVIYPRCKAFEDYNCVQQAQDGQVGTCLDGQGKPAQLKCCKTQSRYTKGMVYLWSKPEACVN